MDMGYDACMETTLQSLPVFEDVLAAAGRLSGVAVATPLVESPALSERLSARVFLKLETLQRTGSFKFRGAYNRLSLFSPAQRKAGVVSFSSGNHAQGIAAAAGMLRMPATIVMPADAPAIKVANTRALGAEVVLYDRKRESREQIADTIAAKKGAIVVPSFDDPGIIAGQGTAGLEIARAAKAAGAELDAVLVPCSGGGLTSGVALAIHHEGPKTRVFAVEPEGFDGARQSLEKGERVAGPGGETIADALMSTAPGFITFAVLKACGAGGVAVKDAALMRAVSYAARILKLVVEPGGAAALAALLSGAFDAKGKTIAVILSGGNIDPAMLMRCLDAVPAP
jgi:threonine dehydratase